MLNLLCCQCVQNLSTAGFIELFALYCTDVNLHVPRPETYSFHFSVKGFLHFPKILLFILKVEVGID